MDFIAISILWALIILALIIIRVYQIKYKKYVKHTRVSKDFSGVDITQLQRNYKILDKMLNNIKDRNDKNYDEEIKDKLTLVGYDKISINENDNSVMLQKEGMSIDLGGIAKGFAADEVLKIYKKYNIENGLINLGASSIYAVGKNKDNNDWSVGIKHPRSENPNEYMGIIKLSNSSLSTSGDYERCFIKDNRRYHHIIDPKTGYPVDNGVMSDTIVIDGENSDSGMLSDLLTTTVFTLGAEKGVKLIDSLQGVSCEITTSDYKVYTSVGFKDRIIDLNKEFQFIN